MGKPISTLHVMIAALAVLLLTVCGNVFAAQSTADAVADVATKEQLRKEILGDATFPGEDAEYVIGYGDVLGVSIYGEGNMAAAPSAGATGTAERPRLRQLPVARRRRPCPTAAGRARSASRAARSDRVARPCRARGPRRTSTPARARRRCRPAASTPCVSGRRRRPR